MRITTSVKGGSRPRQDLQVMVRNANAGLVTAINRTTRNLRARVVTRSTEVYNIGRRDLAPFVTVRQASASKVSGSVRLLVRAIPIEFFRPRVRMQAFTFRRHGKTVTQQLPAIYLRRFKNGGEKYVGPAFPLSQRRSGPLRRGERIRRRIGEQRDRLTRIRYYTFPKQFTEEVLLPDAQAFIGPSINIELRRALRRRNARGGRTLRGNT